MLCSWAELRRIESGKLSFYDEGAEFAVRKESAAGYNSARIHGQNVPGEDMITIDDNANCLRLNYEETAFQDKVSKNENAAGGIRPTRPAHCDQN